MFFLFKKKFFMELRREVGGPASLDYLKQFLVRDFRK